ncbi:Uncharacterized protein NEOC95_000448 [Neochlamydia sp. AcF95]|nr:Uncharacterized protein [Neochlamydia sp. AcF95]
MELLIMEKEEKQKIYCAIRKNWLIATPEELVRQQAIQLLIQHLGFPSSCIAVEKELQSLPHMKISTSLLPERRADIICYLPKENSLHPLLLVECKAVPLTSKEILQVIGYNRFIKASFIALINQTEHKLGWFDPELSDYQFVDYLPFYSDLVNSLIN